MTQSTKLITALALLGLGLAGCAGQEATKPSSSVEDQSVKGAESAGAAAKPGPEGQAVEGQAEGQELKKKVYFTFDSSSVDDENKAVVEANAKYLAANPNVKVSLEGNTDERGTREYNLALGERRAQAVQRMMQALGVAGNRIATVSYGEEKPVAPGHNESAWRLNRRVDFVYK
jgi:peptidoglycan-associated lipoprotein